MKRVWATGILAALLTTGVAHAATQPNIGTVDLQRAVSESKEGAADRASLIKKGEVLNAELKLMLAEAEKLKTELEKGSDKLSADERAEKGRLLQKKGRDLQNRQREAQEELKQTENDYLKKLLTKFGAILKKIGEDDNFTVILDKNNGVFYAGAQTDVTPALVKRADEEYRKD
jgi:Skp family chaperone for outer membrane proteins